MSSSLHFADDFLRTEMEDQELVDSIQQSVHMSAAEAGIDVGTEGLQVITRVIDKMLAKVKVDVVNTTIRILHKSSAPILSDKGSEGDEYYLDLHIPRISYFDETPEFSCDQETPLQSSDMTESSILAPPMSNETIKIITMSSPTVWIRSKQSSPAAPMYSMMPTRDTALQGKDEEEEELGHTEFYEARDREQSISQNTNSIHSSFMSGSTNHGANETSAAEGTNSNSKPYEALLFTTLDKDNWVRIQLRPSFPFGANTVTFENASAIRQIDILCSHVRTIITPRQTAFLLDLLKQITSVCSSAEQISTELKRHSDVSQDHLSRFDFSVFDRPTQNRPEQHFYMDNNRLLQSAPTVTSSPDMKVKFQINTIDLFFLYSDGPDIPSPSIWEIPECIGCMSVDHIKVSMREVVVRYQQFPEHNRPASRKQSDIPFGTPHSPIAHLLSKIDIKITRLTIDEWIRRPHCFQSSRKADNTWQIPYERYIPILEFDESITQDYNHDIVFPSIMQTMTPRLRTRTKHGRGSCAIRIRIEKKQAHEVSRFVNATTLDEDIRITILPLKLHVDAQVLDRLENYVYAYVELQSKWDNATKADDTRDSDNSVGQRIYEDLDRGSNKLQLRKSAHIRCSFIRVLLYVPDMSQVCARDEFNDLLHSDALSVDIKEFSICWKSEGTEQKSEANDASSFTHFQNISEDVQQNADMPIKVQADCDFINVFLKLARDNASNCWFTAKTVVPLCSDPCAATIVTTPQSPSFEITIRSANSIKNSTVSAARPNCFGSGSDIPGNLFEYLSKNESININHKPHMPMEDQTESAMMFKQRTVETSLFVVNCHFPSTRMNLPKEVWDTVQILQNDLILWQPRFLSCISTQSDAPVSKETDRKTQCDMHSRDYLGSYEFGLANSMHSSSMLSQSHERLRYNLQTPSLISLIAVMSDALWDIHYSSKDKESQGSYRLHMSEFRYFTVVKHLGMDENVTTLDIDDLELYRTAPQKAPIACKTIVNNLSPKRNTAMVSLFAKLTNDNQFNKQHKVTSVVICNLCANVTMDLSFLEQLIEFQKIPDEMVFINPPTQYNKIYAHVLDTSIDYKPIHLPSRAVIVVDELQVITDIVSTGQPIQSVKAFLERMDVMLVDDAHDIDNQLHDQTFGRRSSMTVSARQYWANLGFSNVLSLLRLEVLVKIKTEDIINGPKMGLTITSGVLDIEGCTDTFHSFLNLVTYMVNQGDLDVQSEDRKGKKATKKRQPVVTSYRGSSSGDENTDILASLDPEAFQRAAAKIASSPQNNQIPLDLDFIEEYYSSQISRSDHPPQKPRRKHALNKTTEGEFRLLDHFEKLEIVENFYCSDNQTPQRTKPAFDNSRSMISVRVDHFEIVWSLYDGYDAKYMNGSQANKSRRARPSSNGSFNSNHYLFGESLSRTSSFETSATGMTNTSSPMDHDFIDHSPSFSSMTGEDADRFEHRPPSPDIEIRVDGISLQFDLLPDTEKMGVNLVLDIRDFDIIDNVKTSSWNKFLGYMRPGPHSIPRERGSMMIHLEVSSIRPVQTDPTQEFRIKFKLLPVRLYVDQDALNFMVKYFTFDKSLLKSTAFANAAIKVEKEEEDIQEIFFQTIEIYPIVLKVDYKAKHINFGNIKEGQLAELVNLFNLDGADFQLSHVRLAGISGFRRLGDKLAQEWLPHIKNTQVPHVISGVSPIRSVVNLGGGVADLVLLPIQQYKRDGRIIRGLQKGAQSFAKATAMEAIKLSARLASGAQVILEQADDFFSPTLRHEHYHVASAVELFEDDEGYIYAAAIPSRSSSPSSSSAPGPMAMSPGNGAGSAGLTPSLSRNQQQPSDLSQGIQYAYQNLSRNLGAAAQTIFAVPTEVTGEAGSSHTKAVIRAVPVAVIKPMIGLTGAFHSIMVGLRNSIDPNMRLQNEDKYKRW
ncbi:hypothetical protein BX666DRAFT_258603 [Dichotomocladium elegans]|nr:hypothetical protein BX666DRAFT_258603 [Dichotomocladium elegans]